MIDVIKIPTWLFKFEYVDFSYINELIDSSSNYEISLSFLKELYQSNQDVFYKTIDELVLRGFEFYPKNETSTFPNNRFDKNLECIEVIKNENRFVNLDFEKMGIPDFISKFEVTSDKFFNFIPLVGFKHLNKSFDLELAKSEFVSAGFNIEIYNNNLCFDGNQIEFAMNELGKTGIGNENTEYKKIELKDISIIELKISKRSYNALKNIGVNNLYTLVKLNNKDIMKICGVGFESKTRIIDIILNIKKLLPKVKSKKIDGEDLLLQLIHKLDPMGLKTLDLTVKSYKRLRTIGINTKIDLSNLTENDIYNLEELSDKYRLEILDKINLWKKSYDYMLYISDTEIKFEKRFLDIFGDILLSTFPFACLDMLEKKGFTIVSDLNKIPYYEFSNFNIPIFSMIKFIDEIKMILHPKDIIDNFIIEDRDKLILTRRYKYGETFKEIGILVNISRERVRQLIIKSEMKFKKYLEKQKFVDNLFKFTGGANHITKEKLFEFVGDHPIIFKLFEKELVEDFIYFEPLDLFFFYGFNDFLETMSKMMERLDSNFLLEDFSEEIIDELSKFNLEFVDIGKIENLVIFYGYKKQGIYFTRNKINNAMAMELLFENYIEKPLKIDKEGYEVVKSLSKSLFNIIIPERIESSIERIREPSSILLVDKKTFVHISKIDFEPDMIMILDKIIEAELKVKQVICKNELYELLINDYADAKNLNNYTVYSLVKVFLNDKYIIGYKNSMNIYLNDLIKNQTDDELLLEYLVVNGGVATNNDIQECLNWNNIKLMNTVTNYPMFMSLRNGCIKHIKKFKFDKEDLKLLDKQIEIQFEKEILSTPKLFISMENNLKLNELLVKYDIDNPNILSGFLKKNFSNIKGKSTILFRKSSQYKSLEDYIVCNFKCAYKEEIQSFYKWLKLSDARYYIDLSRMINKGIYIEISKKKVMLVNDFIVSSDIELTVMKYLDSQCCNNDYVVLSVLSEFEKKMPKINYEWTIYILRHIAIKNGYRNILKEHSDYRFDRLIILKENSKIYKLDELIYNLLKNEYSGDMNEAQIYDFLSDFGIFNKRDESYKKILPKELSYSRLFDINSVGRVKLNLI